MESTTAPYAAAALGSATPSYWSDQYPHDLWMEEQGIPIHRGYFIEDLRTVELGWWEARQCQAAFIQLLGQQGVSEARVSEIPPGATLPPAHLGIDEVVYVVEGRGTTTVWAGDGGRKTFEWQKHSLFLLPHNCHHQFTNMQGDRPVRLLHYNYLPVALMTQDAEMFVEQAPERARLGGPDGEFYSEAKAIQEVGGRRMQGRTLNFWYGNFFPDMQAWDKLNPLQRRGAGGHSVQIQFPRSQMSCHMSVFPTGTYKKAHRHGPGRVIVIPAGEGYSILWEEGRDKIVAPWHEGSVFVPPEKWFHQHFNLGGIPARYLALHPIKQFYGHAEKVEDRARDQIEYVDEDPFIRDKFESELARRGLQSAMPAEAYANRDYQWSYKG
ncbi:MAG TPA: cupin domain-containing protein [Chloroflexota bacterium]|jgi:oxalate decarboxylase/phosphoglucose isomerase-like protein (cupin superfamily)